MSTLPLIPKIDRYNSQATVFLLSMNDSFLQKAKKHIDPEMCFMKRVEEEAIISPDDLGVIMYKFSVKNNLEKTFTK
jgi:hypothetical protein